jgi:uncharacterized protein YggE
LLDSPAGLYQAWFMRIFLARGLLISVGLLAASVGAGCAPHHVMHGAPPSANAPIRGITVNGVGKASGKPNIARSTVGVEARAATAEDAIGEVNARMGRVIAAIKQAGVADADIRTSNLSLNFERTYEPPRPVEMGPATAPSVAPTMAPAVATPPGKGKPLVAKAEPAAPVAKLPQGFYNATNSVEVTIRNLDVAGKVLSAATAAGADQLYGIRFEIEDPSTLQGEARQKAVADARTRAERLAQLAGLKLGAAVSIVEMDGGGGGGPIMPMASMARMEAAPVERGELTVSSTVQIVYALPE